MHQKTPLRGERTSEILSRATLEANDKFTSGPQRRAGLYFGLSEVSRELVEQVEAYAAIPYPILLVGPTGSGKTALATHIHGISKRGQGPFVSCSLAGIPLDLRHAELCGTVRGAFTGAATDRKGVVEAAHGGTLFLDELGHAPLPLQQTLLTIVESSTVQRLGETFSRAVSTRFIFASSSDLHGLCASGRMLEELLYRIEGFTIQVPGLAQRRDDIIPMAEQFIAEALEELGRRYRVELSGALRARLRAAPWPGNIRQLKSSCRRLALAAQEGRPLTERDLEHPGENRESPVSARQLALRAIENAGGNKSKAARALGITRGRLYRLLTED